MANTTEEPGASNQPDSKTANPDPKELAEKSRQVPIWIPTSLSVLIMVGFVVVASIDLGYLELLFAFPMGLTMLLVEPLKSSNETMLKFLLGPLFVLPYVCYAGFFFSIFLARSWKAFLTVLILFACLILLNLAGCRKIGEALSGIQ